MLTLAGGLIVKARVQHPQVKPRKDRQGWPWVFRYRHDEIQPDGSLTNKQLRCEAGSDGMTLDAEGNLYLTGNGGVHVFDKTGRRIELIEVPETPANVCFGGKDKQTLFITARKGFYSIRTKIKGANAAK